MSGAKHRQKGNRIEREIVERHREIGIHAERVPLSGASRYRDNGADVDVYVFGKEEAPLVSEVKGRREGKGFALIERWLGEYDLLFLRRDRLEPLVVLPWSVWVHLIAPHVYNGAQHGKATQKAQDGACSGVEERSAS